MSPGAAPAEEDRLARAAERVARIASAAGATEEDVAEAFLVLRPECLSDDEALDALEDASAGRPVPELCRRALSRYAEARRLRRDAAPVAGDATLRFSGPSPHPPGVPLEVSHDVPTGPTPEAVRMVKMGAVAYHLLTLAALAEEAPPGENPLMTAAELHAAASVSGLARRRAEARVGGQDGPRPRTVRGRYVDRARRASGPGPCGSAGCRSFEKCICDCRKCRAGCRGR